MSLADTINTGFAPISQAANAIIFYSVNILGVSLPLVVVWLIAAAFIITLYLRFINLSGFAHAIKIVSGKITHEQKR